MYQLVDTKWMLFAMMSSVKWLQYGGKFQQKGFIICATVSVVWSSVMAHPLTALTSLRLWQTNVSLAYTNYYPYCCCHLLLLSVLAVLVEILVPVAVILVLVTLLIVVCVICVCIKLRRKKSIPSEETRPHTSEDLCIQQGEQTPLLGGNQDHGSSDSSSTSSGTTAIL